MGKKLSAARVALWERGGFLLAGLLLALMVCGCADTGDASDKDRGGFYGGVSGGYSVKR
jgi:hypothetical protein